MLRAAAGTDLTRHSPAVATVRCPFTGEHLTAVAALNPDVTIVHAQRADRAGNVQLWGISGVQKEAVLAARHAIATVEEVVDELTPMPGGVVLPRFTRRRRRGRAGRGGALVRARLLRPRQRRLPRSGRRSAATGRRSRRGCAGLEKGESTKGEPDTERGEP